MSHLLTNVSLQAYHTFGIDVSSAFWVSLDSQRHAVEFLVDNIESDMPVLMLGGGSNMLFTQDWSGLVIHNQIKGIDVVQTEGDYIWIRVGGGENWHELVMHCLEQGWGGIENLSLIPGSVGAAPIQNIGAYGVELTEVFVQLEAIQLSTGLTRTFDRQSCQFGYRDSIFKRHAKGKFLITSVTLRLTRQNHRLNTTYGAIPTELEKQGLEPSIATISKVVCDIRKSKLPDPDEIGNAGSFFKNPIISNTAFEAIQAAYPSVPHYPQPDGKIKLPAAWLIQTCGWKGKRIGNYGVHERQALVLVNYGGANGADILSLSQDIQASVAETFQIELEREVNVY